MSKANQAPGGEVKPNSTTDFKGKAPAQKRAPKVSGTTGGTSDPVQPNNRGNQGNG